MAGHHEGVAVYANLGTDEQLKMLNVRVHITKGAELFPKSTESYGLSDWTFVEDFIEMWNGKDVTRIGIDPKDALQGVCVTGLCISSTYDILAAEMEARSVVTSEPSPKAARGA